jgi:TrmH family RNA methyltransferase
MKHITSADNPQYRMLLKLAQSSRERRKAGLSLLDGIHLVSSYVNRFGAPVQVAVSETAVNDAEIARLLSALHPAEPLLLAPHLFASISTVETPTGILASIQTPRAPALPARLDTCLLLEDIQDPGNLGSILRSASGAGITQVCLSKNSVHCWSPRVLRAGMGAHFMLDIHEQCDLAEIAHGFIGRVIVTALSAKKSLYTTDLTGNVALVFGNEGAGVSPGLQKLAHETMKIPMPGKIESLNVGAAVAVCLFERVRQLSLTEKSIAV